MNSKSILYIIKIGGNVIDNPDALTRFLKDFSSLKGNKVLVHGGGKIASQIGEKMGLKPQYINGRRITDAATLDLVTMVYGGLINRQITTKLQSLGCNSIGLTGADGNLLCAKKRPMVGDLDFGWVGDVQHELVNGLFLQQLLSVGLTPIVAPLTHDGFGHLLNTNADTMAAMPAIRMQEWYEVRLIYCFEKKGILKDISLENEVISSLNATEYQAMKANGTANSGILPKLDNAFEVSAAGVKWVIVGHADDLLANATGENAIGTQIGNIR
jgi:acetylglutamate kinase